jgi:hypothetical protein
LAIFSVKLFSPLRHSAIRIPHSNVPHSSFLLFRLLPIEIGDFHLSKTREHQLSAAPNSDQRREHAKAVGVPQSLTR